MVRSSSAIEDLRQAPAGLRSPGEALLLNWFDIAGGREQDFDDWHNREHVIERMGVPGFMEGRRFEALDGAPERGHSYLVAYDASAASIFESPAYAQRLDNPTPLTAKVVPCLQNLTRTAYRIERRMGRGIGSYVSTIRLTGLERTPTNLAALTELADSIYTIAGVCAVVLGVPDGRITHFKDSTEEGKATQTLVRDDYPLLVMVEACRTRSLQTAIGTLRKAIGERLPSANPVCHSFRLVFSMTAEQAARK